MIIDQLPTISPPVQDTDELAIERGTQTYKVSVGDSFVKKTGDTMSGALHIDKPTTNAGFLALKNTATDITGTSFPSTAYPSVLYFQDKNGKAYGQIVSSQRADGATGIGLWAMNKAQNSTHGFGLRFDNNGNRLVAFDEAKPWQDALGITVINNVVNYIYQSHPLLTRLKRTYSNITFNSTGYAQIDTVTSMATQLNAQYVTGLALIGMYVQGFATGDVYGLALGSDQSTIYAIGKPNTTISSFGVRYLYLNTTPESYP